MINFSVHFHKLLSDADNEMLEMWLYNLDKNYLDNESICSEIQYNLAEFFEDIIQKISLKQDGLLLDVIKKTFDLEDLDLNY